MTTALSGINNENTGTNRGNFTFSLTDDTSPEPSPEALVRINVSDAAPPTFADTPIATGFGHEVLLRFSKAMADMSGKQEEFSIIVDGAPNPVTTVMLSSYSPTEVVFTLSTPLSTGQTVEISYDATAGTVQSADGGVLASFTRSFEVPAVLEPTNFVVQAVGKNQINLSWRDNSDNETEFEIYRATTVGGPYTLHDTAPADTERYEDIDLTRNTPYYYQVRAVDATIPDTSRFTEVKGARTFVANLTVTANAIGHGSISNSGVTEVLLGDTLAYDMTANPGYHVADVVVDGISQGSGISYAFEEIQRNHQIVVYFQETVPSYAVSISSSIGGSTSPSGLVNVEHDGDLTVSFSPDSGYLVADVLLNGVSLGAISDYTFSNVRRDHNLFVQFAPDTPSYTVTATAGPNGAISPAGIVSVDAGASQTFAFSPASGFQVARVMVNDREVALATSYTFPNVRSDQTIHVTFSPVGVDHIITANHSPYGILSPAGVVPVADGDTQTFQMTPEPGAHLVDVEVNGVSVGPLTTYTFTNVRTDQTIYAHFAPESVEHAITASAGANGSISPSGAIVVPTGSQQSFNILPDSGYRVSAVFVNGTNVGAVNSYVFSSVNRNHTIHATFIEETPEYEVTASAGAGGAISPSGINTVQAGDSISFIITPDTGYAIRRIRVNGVSVGTVSAYTFSNVQTTQSIHAEFESDEVTYTITASSNPYGTIDPSGEVVVSRDAGQSFQITPEPDHQLLDVRVDGDSVGALGYYTFSNVRAHHTIEAIFSLPSYTLIYSATTGGSIDDDASQTVEHGADGSTVTAVPNAGYHFVQWSDGVTTASRTETNVTVDVTVEAQFAINEYVLTYTAGTGGSIDGDTTQTVEHGADGSTVTAAPDTGYHFVQWSDGVTTASRAETNVTESINVTAVFEDDGPIPTPLPLGWLTTLIGLLSSSILFCQLRKEPCRN